MFLFRLIGKVLWLLFCLSVMGPIVCEMVYISTHGGGFFNPFSFKAWKERMF